MSETPTNQKDSAGPLRQNQVETLLRAMETVQHSGAHPDTPARPTDAIDPQIISAICALHGRVAVDLTRELGAILRTGVDVQVADVAEVTYAQFEQAADDHRWLSVISPNSLPGDWCLELSPQLCCVMVDRMLGGEPTPGETFARPMTDIERRLVQRVVDSALQSLLRGWQSVDELTWIVRHQDAVTTPRPIASGAESVIQTRFAVSLCEIQAAMRLCIPAQTLEGLHAQLCERDWQTDPSGGHRKRLLSNVASAGVDVVVTLADSTIRTGDLLDLNVGDIIATEKSIDQPLEMKIQNVPKFKTRVGALQGRKAVQVQSPLERTADDDGEPPQIVTAKNKE
jgi:flagellar motor switch protein FliM